jgi:hypothetical protein
MKKNKSPTNTTAQDCWNRLFFSCSAKACFLFGEPFCSVSAYQFIFQWSKIDFFLKKLTGFFLLGSPNVKLYFY